MYTMPDPAARPSHDRWRDIDGIHRGQVVGRCLDSFYVRFADNALIGLPPQLVRLIPDALGQC
jgi:hypothetical protein